MYLLLLCGCEPIVTYRGFTADDASQRAGASFAINLSDAGADGVVQSRKVTNLQGRFTERIEE